MPSPKTWLIVGASRGIGLEFVRQIVASGHRVVATVRTLNPDVDALVQSAPDKLKVLTCDVSRDESINVRLSSCWLNSGKNELTVCCLDFR